MHVDTYMQVYEVTSRDSKDAHSLNCWRGYFCGGRGVEEDSSVCLCIMQIFLKNILYLDNFLKWHWGRRPNQKKKKFICIQMKTKVWTSISTVWTQRGNRHHPFNVLRWGLRVLWLMTLGSNHGWWGQVLTLLLPKAGDFRSWPGLEPDFWGSQAGGNGAGQVQNQLFLL